MIAQRCGVHYSTVQRALNDQGRISAATRERINAVAVEMGYDPHVNQDASRLIRQRHGGQIINHVVAFYLPPIFYQHNYYMRILTGLWEVLVARHYDMLTTYYEMDGGKVERQPVSRSIVSGNVDAVIAMLGPERTNELQQQLRGTPRFGPRPIIGLLEGSNKVSMVVFDEYAGAYALCKHLLKLGHCRFVYPHPNPEISDIVPQRIRGYRDAIAEAGLSPDRSLRLVKIGWGDKQWEGHFIDALREGMATSPAPTAVLLPHDTVAVAARNALRAWGKQVPRDVSLVGFDDADILPDEQGQNILTTIHLPLEELGRTAARMAIRQINAPAPVIESIVLPVSLVIRQSALSPRE